MLTLFRELVRSKFSLVIIGLLIASLALFGVPDFFGSLLNQNLGNSLTKADSHRLEISDVDRVVDRIIRDDQQKAQAEAEQTGEDVRDTISAQALAQDGSLNQIIDQLSDQNIRIAYVEKLGLMAGQDEIKDLILSNDIFRHEITGEFDRTIYQENLARVGYNRERDYEKALRSDVSLDNVNMGLSSALRPTKGMSDLWALYDDESRNTAYFLYSIEDLPETASRPTEEEVTDFYYERQDILTAPERRQFSIIAVNAQDFEHKVTVTDEEVRNEYEAQIAKYSGPATRTYMLLSFDTVDQARTALGELGGGTDQNSVGGVLSEEFTAVEPKGVSAGSDPYARDVFSSPMGAWVGTIQTLDGKFALVKVTSEIAGEPYAFEDVQEFVRRGLIQSRAKRLYSRSIDDIEDAIGAGFTLEEMADILGSPVYTYPPVDQRGYTEDGLPLINLMMLPGALQEGFQLFENENSPRMDAVTSQFIIRVDRVVAPYVPDLEEIREDLTESLYLQRQSEALDAYTAAAEERIKSGEATITTEAAILNKEVIRPPEAITRATGEQLGYPQQLLGPMFGAALDEPYSVNLQGVQILGVVEAITLPDEAALEANRSVSDANVLVLINRDLRQGFAILASQNVDIQINNPMIQAYLDQYLEQE